MPKDVKSNLSDAEVEEVESCEVLARQLWSLLAEQAHGGVSLPPEALVPAFSVLHALGDRAEQLLTQSLAPPPPEPPPEPPPGPPPLEQAFEAEAKGG